MAYNQAIKYAPVGRRTQQSCAAYCGRYGAKNMRILLVAILLANWCSFATASELSVEHKGVLAVIQNANFCVRDSDCKIVGDFCPIGCDIVVNSTKASEVTARLKSMVTGCEFDCINTKKPPVCAKGKCQIIAP